MASVGAEVRVIMVMMVVVWDHPTLPIHHKHNQTNAVLVA